MYAIIQTGGKQYRVAEGDIIDVELLEGEIGSQVQLDNILFVFDGSNLLVGEPTLNEYQVIAELLGEVAGPKVTSVKYIPGNHRKKIGHRQHYSRLKIIGIGSHSQTKKGKGAHHGT